MSLNSRNRASDGSAASWHIGSPRTPLKSEKHRGAYPCWDSPSGRRLFPTRRTITPVLTILNTKAGPYNSPFQVYSSPIKAPQENEDQLSDDDSLSSTGSVKIDLLSTLDLPPFDADTSSTNTGYALTPSKSASKPACNGDSQQHTTVQRSPTASAAKSTEQPEQTELSELNALVLIDSLCGSRQGKDSDAERHSLIKLIEPNNGYRSELTHFESPASRIEAESASATKLLGSNQALDHVKDTIHQIDSWESSVSLCSNFLNNNDGRIQINHHVRMTVIVPKVYIIAERVSLSIIVSNGIRGKHQMPLRSEQHSLFFQEHISSTDITDNKDGEIIIVRDTCDLDIPLDLYLSLTYKLHDQPFIIASLPTFRPREGKTLSEIIAITHPAPPLAIKPLPRGDFSTWKEVARPISHAISFERVVMPRLYPKGFTDDLRIKVCIPSPVFFNCLDSLRPCDLAWNFNIIVEEVIGGTIECDMRFCLEIAEADSLVSIDPHGWAPKYFVIDGRLATEQAGEWRENETGLLTLFKRNGMVRGPVYVEMHWQEPNNLSTLNGGNTRDIPLPRVTDLKIMGGDLTCRTDKRFMVLGDSGASSRLHAFFDRPHARLPPMFPGYKLYLTPNYDEQHLPLHSLSRENELVALENKQSSAMLEIGDNVERQESSFGGSNNSHCFTCHAPLSPVAEENGPVESQEKESSAKLVTGDKANCQEIPLVDVGHLRGFKRNPPSSPLTDEDKLAEMQSKVARINPETSAEADSPEASPDQSEISRHLESSLPDTLLAIFLSLCLIFLVHFYIHSMNRRDNQPDYSVQGLWGSGTAQKVAEWQEGRKISLLRASLEGDEAIFQDTNNKSDVKATHVSKKDGAIRPRSEIVRDWIDHMFWWEEWQGYA